MEKISEESWCIKKMYKERLWRNKRRLGGDKDEFIWELRMEFRFRIRIDTDRHNSHIAVLGRNATQLV